MTSCAQGARGGDVDVRGARGAAVRAGGSAARARASARAVRRRARGMRAAYPRSRVAAGCTCTK